MQSTRTAEETLRGVGRAPASAFGDASPLPTAGDRTAPPAGEADVTDPRAPMSPGDEAPPGTPGTGENVCPHCNGRGKDADGHDCPVCGGTGKVTTGIGGA